MTEIENRITNLLDPNQSYVVALSGGVDSSVLLHIVHSYTSNVRSVFVNHNQKDSDKLQKSAETIAKDLGIDHLNLDTQLDSDSSETKMRDARYEAFFNNMRQDEILLLGHHNDDRVETFMINLFRGTRLKGLLSIKQETKNILRPLIDIKKSSIINYAQEKKINFLEDSTNKDNSILRNWLRNEIIPNIEKNFKGDLNNKIQSLIYEIDELTKNDKDLISYIKTAEGYIEVPISLIDKNNSASYYLLSTISQYIGQSGLQNSDIKKIFSVIEKNIRKSFLKIGNFQLRVGFLSL
jgi:tRNA(Ile)-lysidine synthase